MPAAAITRNCRSPCPLRRRAGRRLLVRPGPQADAVRGALVAGLVELCRIDGASGVHVTFATEPEYRFLGELGFLQRTDQQFHWENPGYASFDDFLAALAARKRKTIRRERHDALANGISVHWLTGSDLTEDVWDHFFAFYMETGSRKWGRPYLTRPFFSLVGETMRDRILLVMAKRSGRWIAGAINFIGSHTLFGRHWGAIEHHPFLHFELCYYQAIDYAIAHKLLPRRGRRPGRAQNRPRLYADNDLLGPFHRRSGVAAGDRRLSCARARLCRGRRRRACGRRALSPRYRARGGLIRHSARSGGEHDAELRSEQRLCQNPARRTAGAQSLRGRQRAFAFLDIMPRAPGHTLVIPKAPARTILDIAPDDLAHLVQVTQRIARAAMTVFSADGLTVQQFNEPAGGQVVFHLHIHVIPRKIGVALKPPASFKEEPAVLSDQALKLAAAVQRV